MSGRFFVTGLPRSRTAWFSVATTTPNSVCWHEPLSRLQSYGELCEFWTPRFGVDIGISDSGLAPQIGRILEDLKPRTLIIHRPLEDALQSFRVYANAVGISVDEAHCSRFSRLALEALDRAAAHPLVKQVYFGSLEDYGVMKSCMEWLLPSREFPDLSSLMAFNIQVSKREIQRTFRLPHTNWHLG